MSGVPQHPEIDDLYWDGPTCTMRVWDGKHWKEANPSQVEEAIERKRRIALAKST